MKYIIRVIFLFFLFVQLGFASNSYYQKKFNENKKSYLGAVMSGDRTGEIKYLKKLINYGDKLNKDTLKYKKELNRLDRTLNIKNSVQTQFKLKPKYTIKSVSYTYNTITIEFNKKVNKSYINFFEKRYKNYSRDYFDIKGNFKYALETKIKLDGIDRTTIYQHKKDTLRIYLQNKINPKTIYFINHNKIVIKNIYIDQSKKVKSKPNVKVRKKGFKKKDLKNILFKTNYSINSVKQTKNSIIIDFNKNIDKSYIDFWEKKYRNFHRDYFDIKGNYEYAKEKKIVLNGVDKTVIYQHKKDTLRLYLQKNINPKTIYIIAKKRIIIKYMGDTSKVRSVPKSMNVLSRKVVVLDPGHGGKDPGAVNKRVYEKDIVFNITKYVKAELQRKGFKVYLTRNKDKYIKLSYRTKYANRKKADIFVSIHANAVPKRNAYKVQGVETYFLSPARSKRAKRVAALENKGDMSNMGWSSKSSLLTILNQSKITASNKMAIDIQKNMLHSLRNKYGKNTIKDGGVREGPFWVLVGAQMPAVLVEVGYISHPKEIRRMKTRIYQKTVAKAIAKGIENYFIKNEF